MITRSIEENLPKFTCIGRRVEAINLPVQCMYNLGGDADRVIFTCFLEDTNHSIPPRHCSGRFGHP